ncbi:uncharacterized protein LOC131655056 [Vicia villosa]|uniref:uncharacterized protein LOC131655056 n=1 Tax=Vicia villosa TaxID=3911 RepID=UPI00273C37FD|nr:uncharacterized protein LOC131655056 [Vicia villosa]
MAAHIGGGSVNGDRNTVKGVTIDVCNEKGNGRRSYITISSDSSSSDDEEEKTGEFKWEKEIDFGYVSSKNVMNFPWQVTKEWFGRNQKSITLVDGDNGDTYNAVIRCAKRFGKVEWREKFMCKGWYEYAKKKRIRRRDVLGFAIKRPADKVVVNLLKRQNQW